MTVTSEVIVEISSYQAPALTKTRPTRHRFTWDNLSEGFLKHRRSQTKNVAGWSPAIYEEGRTRGNDYVVSVSCAVGDFDHCTNDDLLAVKDRMAELGLTYVLYSTYSCTPDELAFRVVVPFTEPASKDEWNDVWHRCNAHLFGGKNDKQTKDQSRFFYVPSAPPDALVFAERHDGATLDIAALPPAPYGAADEHEPLDHDLIINGIPEGERDWTLYRMACDMRGKGVPIEYALLTIVEAARRCSPPFDESEAEKKVVQAYRQFQPNPVLSLNGHVQPSELQDAATPFPIDALPEEFRVFVEHVSRLKVCPPEFVAVPLLVASGAMLGNVVGLVLNSSWIERPQIFAAIVGPPGAKKSPAITAALAPVRGIQQKLGDQYMKALTRYRAEKARWDKIPKKEREDHDPPTAPTYSHVMTNDVTTEKLAEMLAKSKGILLSHDELAAWVLSMDQYRSGKGADRQHFLSMWTGTSFKVDRKINPEPIYVKHPCLGIIGGIQPEMLTSLVDKQGRSDGFLDRILWAYPESLPGHWVDDDDMDTSAINEVFQKLYDCYGTTDLLGNHVELKLRFSDESRGIWKEWYNETEDDIGQQRIERSLEGSWAKMPSQCARIAVILHMINGDNANTISADTLRRAIAITEYFKGQCRRVFASLSALAGKDEGLRVLEYLKEHGEVSQTEIANKVFMKHKRADDMGALLTDLESRGLIARREELTAGPKRTLWSLS